ncbi:NADH dehydrogenase [ubiquinone] 1 subunit C1, mitochondrial [Heliangelus exortis]|uniref:NADH dehydrogenase [ubiquinone] 1 subunit C1, mitochondrial n=1 Tax=Heliangelus exortis TaxID=472823 RepID=UPI003A9066EC
MAPAAAGDGVEAGPGGTCGKRREGLRARQGGGRRRSGKMAAAVLGLTKRLRLVAGAPSLAFTRSAFVAKKRNYDQPNWFGVALAFGTSAALWAFLFKQHNDDVMEYERRKQERHHKCTECS